MTPCLRCNRIHDKSAEELIDEKYGTAGMSPDETILTIKMGWGFERYGTYDSWDSGYDVALYALRKDYRHWNLGKHKFLEKPLVTRHRCLTRAVELVFEKAKELECQED